MRKEEGGNGASPSDCRSLPHPRPLSGYTLPGSTIHRFDVGSMPVRVRGYFLPCFFIFLRPRFAITVLLWMQGWPLLTERAIRCPVGHCQVPILKKKRIGYPGCACLLWHLPTSSFLTGCCDSPDARRLSVGASGMPCCSARVRRSPSGRLSARSLARSDHLQSPVPPTTRALPY